MKIQTGFNPIESNFLLQLCYHNSGFKDISGLTPKIPVQIPQPTGWGLKHSHDVQGVGFDLWQNERNEHQLTLIFNGAEQEVSFLTSTEFTRLRAAKIELDGQVYPLGDKPTAKCNDYFLNQFQKLLPALNTLMTQSRQPYELYLAGHGLGAALATLALSCCHQSQLQWTQPSAVKIYTFGSPKVGNADFTNQLNQLSFNNNQIDSLAFNISNTNDLICDLPQNMSLNPKLQGQIKSFRLRFIHFMTRVLYYGISSAYAEPYAAFGTPVLLSNVKENTEAQQAVAYQHDIRNYYKLLSQQFPT